MHNHTNGKRLPAKESRHQGCKASEVNEEQKARHNPVDVAPAKTESINFDRSIELTSVAFTYPEASAPAVDGISMSIAKGTKVAFVGPSGSGKTTLVDIIMGLLEADSGEILIDNVPLNQQRYSSWRGLIGYVPQDCLLYTSPSPRDLSTSRMPSSA